MATPRTYVDIFADGLDFAVRAAVDGSGRILDLGDNAGAKVFLKHADLIRLRDVIDTYLSTYAEELRGEGEKKERVAA